ncbi:IS66 family insertion sequence element accessory protein TnpA [Pseudoalteromonas piscicida]|uniref:IS66 family insertion sequence element accessory protein TnpA n=1 Tax=Pseudoalteromonas piscicida TaxID=43662 RepID=UPI003C7C1796
MPKHKTAEQWIQLIEQQELSGLSVSDFCTQHDLSIKSFYNRRSKIRKQTLPQSTFVAAKPATPGSVSPSELLQLKHGQSTVLLPSTTDTLWLAALLKALS